MKTLRISFDIAIRSSGVCFFVDNKMVRFYGVQLNKGENTTDYYKKMVCEFENIIYKAYDFKHKGECDKIELIYELANFSKLSQTTKYAFIGGVITSLFVKYFSPFKNIEIKSTNANGGYEHFNNDYCGVHNWVKLPSEKRKEFAMNHFFNHEEIKAIKSLDKSNRFKGDDIADAFGLGKYYDKIKQGEPNGVRYNKSNRCKKKH